MSANTITGRLEVQRTTRKFALCSFGAAAHKEWMQSAASFRENIILIGFMGSGKSSIGKRVAKKLGFQFLDTDHLVTERAGESITDVFAHRGEAAFREMETSVLISLGHLTRCVVSTGGGIVIREENRVLLREMGFVVGLTATEEVIFERVSRNDKRPLLQTEDPRTTLSELLEARRPFYRDTAHFTLDTTSLPHAEAAEEIVKEARQAFSWHREE
jgi:shikimate kinase